MTTLSMTDSLPDTLGTEACETATRSAFALPRRLWTTIVERIVRRRTLRKLYRLDPHILRDMGFDPAEVYGMYEGTFGEVHGDRFRGL